MSEINKQEIIKQYQRAEGDSGSPEVRLLFSRPVSMA